MAKLEGDGWLSWRDMGGYVGGRWVAKLEGDEWLSWWEEWLSWWEGWLSWWEMGG